ncbi:MAG: noncanonical pyrimidine nucleotidase, YjjG family [Bacteroidetes bacterium]|nr:noncanonical pyrimidine nucleotidase, YjjG family [Bacteroidota bacterium]
MSSKYKHIFFDLDGTLWDIHRNAELTLKSMWSQFDLDTNKWDVFYEAYLHHNHRVWAMYRQGIMTKEELRIARFSRSMDDAAVAYSADLLEQFAQAFVDQCPRQPHLIPGAMELLQYLHAKSYTMHIITNGFKEIQGIKMDGSGLTPFFVHNINSEDVGVRKPDSKIFEYAFRLAETTAAESIMIGDDWDADILGARNVNMDQVFLKLNQQRHNVQPTFTIEHLLEIKNIL